MANITPQATSPLAQSRIEYIVCPACNGFGYEMTPARKHIRCHHCNDNPSLYALLDGELLHWKLSITEDHIKQRKVRDFSHKLLNMLLLLFGIVGVAAFGWTFYVANADVLFTFDDPHPLMMLFWGSIIIDAFLYYRLDKEKESHRSFNYSEEAAAKFKPYVPPKRPTWDKLKKAHHHKIDIHDFYTDEAVKTIDRAFELAVKLDHHVVTPLHLLAALLDAPTISVIMTRLAVNNADLVEKIGSAMAAETLDGGEGVDLGLEATHMLFFAYEEAKERKRDRVDVMELFGAIIHHDPWVNEIFYDMEIEDNTVRNVIEWIHIRRDLRRRYQMWSKKASSKPTGIMDRAMTARPSPLLQSMSTDYTSMAARGGFFPLIGRQKEVEQMLRILRQPIGNVILVGPSGVGKTTLFEGLAELMASEDVPKELQDKRLVVLDPGALLADAKGVGTVEGRINTLINEIAVAGNIILGIEDIHHLLNMRSTSASEDVASILMNALSQGLIKVIATTTTPEYQEYIANRATFLRRFQLVKVDELDRDASIQVLEAKSGSIEYKNKVFFAYDAIEACVDLTSRFMPDRYLPSKALDIMSETGSFVMGTKGENAMVVAEDVAQVISDKTNVEVTAITDDERDKLLNLEEIMHKRVIGQDTAINAVASALRRAREGLRDPNRPIANLLFLGPTGVGKTETVKTIAEVYFGNEENMIRFDMSEYQVQSSLRKLIGSKGEGGLLTEAIRLKPFSIVLLDELEKAHPDILNVFLQVMDDGRITDGTGRTIDMSNSMIVATSNAGTQIIQNSLQAGLTATDIKNKLMEGALEQWFRPEFLNRFDNVVVFEPLRFEQVVQIARLLLQRLSEKVLEEKGIVMEVEDRAVVELAQMGYDPQFGARPLKRVIQDTVDDALAKLLLENKISRRDVIVLKPGGVMEVHEAQRL